MGVDGVGMFRMVFCFRGFFSGRLLDYVFSLDFLGVWRSVVFRGEMLKFFLGWGSRVLEGIFVIFFG